MIGIPLDLLLSHVLTENTRGEVLIGFLLLLIQVARIVASSFFTMSAPRCQTQPAEMMATISASHMVATLILLNIASTLRTRLSVGLDPHEILRIKLFLLVPLLDLETRCWHVLFLCAGHAILVPALAFYPFFGTEGTQFSYVLTIFIRTPLDILVGVGVLFDMPIQVLSLVLELGCIFHERQKHAVWHHTIASKLLACGEYGLHALLCDFFTQVGFPRGIAELMATF